MTMSTGGTRIRLALGGLALAAVALLAVNLLAGIALKSQRIDLTEEGLYTLSGGTRKVLADLDESMTARLYFSRNLGERSSQYALHHDRVKELLEQYVSLSAGKLTLEFYDPEPFSDAEDRAVGSGLQGVPVSNAGDLGYFGLAVANSTDLEAVIPFFSVDRETFVEYDLTKLIQSLAHPEKRVIGVLAGLPVDGGYSMPLGNSPRWIIMDQLREFYELRTLEPTLAAIPEGVDTLLLIQPRGLTKQAQYAIDQFVLGGGKALVFVDPNPETDRMGSHGPLGDDGSIDALLAAWGVRLAGDQVAGDMRTARRVNAGEGSRAVISDYVAWLALGPDNFAADDVITGDLQRVNLATAGILETVKEAGTEVTPLLTLGPEAMRIDADKVRDRPDVVALFRDYQPGGQPLTLAARIGGPARSAFPDGAPPEEKAATAENEEAKAAKAPPAAKAPHLAQAKESIHVVVVADVDMLYDRFWVAANDFFGQQVLVPTASNGDLVVNSLDALGGSAAMAGLRGRGRAERPFELMEDLRRDAERRYRAKEQELVEKLKTLQGNLDRLQRKSGEEGAELILGPLDKAAIADFRKEMVVVRKELRGVQHALRQDIESLEGWLKFWNIAGVPLALGAGVLAMVVMRRRRSLPGGGTMEGARP